MQSKKKTETESLLTTYYSACNAILKAFCRKHGYNYDAASVGWVAGDVGGVVLCGDEYYNMDTIITDLREDAPEEELMKWYSYTLDCAMLGAEKHSCNFRSWLRGCPRLSDVQMEEIRRAKESVKEAEEGLKQAIERNSRESEEF